MHVTTTKADSGKLYSCGTCGGRTDSNGVSTLSLYTRTEPEPGGIGEERGASVYVTAKLDMTDFPFKPSDFIILSEGDALKFPAKKILDLVLSAEGRAGLPSKTITIKVWYHTPDIYIAKGKRTITSFIYYDLPISVDLYSCSGLKGPWQGEGSFGTEESAFGDIMRPIWAQVFPDYPLPPPGERISEPQNFYIDPGSKNWVPLLTRIGLYGDMTLFPEVVDYYNQNGIPPPPDSIYLIYNVYGKIEAYAGGVSFAAGEELGGTPFNIPILSADSDPRCPSGEAKFGEE